MAGSNVATVVINVGLSYFTVPGILPDPFFQSYVDNFYRAKHGTISMTYDNQDRFRPQQLEANFAKYNRRGKVGLNVSDVGSFWKEQRMVFDFFERSACALEYE